MKNLHGAFAVAAVLAGCAGSSRKDEPRGAVQTRVLRQDFRGWDALVLSNGVIEATVVPAIGRVMQLGRAGEPGGPFWSNPRLAPDLPPDQNGWINLGGDKAWPAPQSEWKAVTGADWPPPRTFDHAPYAATVSPGAVELLSGVDPSYGVRVRRRVALGAGGALVIDTAYEKVSGPPVKVAVWTITQLAAPDRLFALLPERSGFPGGHASRLPAAPRDLAVNGRVLSLARDPQQKTLIATDAEALAWVGPRTALSITWIGGDASPGPWPDGAHAQIYTSPDASEPYVELELLSPVRELAIGDAVRMSVQYVLQPRTQADPTTAALAVLPPP